MNENCGEIDINDVEKDIENLLACMKCHEETGNIAVIQETLKTIVALCSNHAAAKDNLRHLGGLDFLFDVMIKCNNLTVIIGCLNALACIIDQNVYNQKHLSTKQMFEFIHGILCGPDFTSSIMTSTVFLFMTLLFQNGSAQVLARETGCLRDLIELYQVSLPKYMAGLSEDYTSKEHPSLGLWQAVNSALCFAVNNPQNEENQLLCSSLFPLALKIVECSTTQCIIRSVASFLSLTIANTVCNQDQFAEHNGILILRKCLKREVSLLLNETVHNNVPSSCVISSIMTVIGIIDVAASDHEINAETVGDIGIITVLIKLLLKVKNDVQVATKIILTLGHCIDACEKNQIYILEEDGFPSVLKSMITSFDKDLQISAKYLLLTCLKYDKKYSDECLTTPYVPVKTEVFGKKSIYIKSERKSNEYVINDNCYDKKNIENKDNACIDGKATTTNYKNIILGPKRNSSAENGVKCSLRPKRILFRRENSYVDKDDTNSSKSTLCNFLNKDGNNTNRTVVSHEQKVKSGGYDIQNNLQSVSDIRRKVSLKKSDLPCNLSDKETEKIFDTLRNKEPSYHCKSSVFHTLGASTSAPYEDISYDHQCLNEGDSSFKLAHACKTNTDCMLLGASICTNKKTKTENYYRKLQHNSCQQSGGQAVRYCNENARKPFVESLGEKYEENVHSCNVNHSFQKCSHCAAQIMNDKDLSNEKFTCGTSSHIQQDLSETKTLCICSNKSRNNACVTSQSVKPDCKKSTDFNNDLPASSFSVSQNAHERRILTEKHSPHKIDNADILTECDLNVWHSVSSGKEHNQLEATSKMLGSKKTSNSYKNSSKITDNFYNGINEIKKISENENSQNVSKQHCVNGLFKSPNNFKAFNSQLKSSSRASLKQLKNSKLSFVHRKCPGCLPPSRCDGFMLNSRTFNTSIETDNFTCPLHRLLRTMERNYIRNVWKKNKFLHKLDKRINKNFKSSKAIASFGNDPYYFHTDSDTSLNSIREGVSSINTTNKIGISRKNKQDTARRSRVPFTKEEEQYILEGAKKLNKNWKCILWSFCFHPSRSAVDLYDKYRRMQKQNVTTHNFTSKAKVQTEERKKTIPFSMCEDRRLMRGVKCYQNNWKKILSSFKFKFWRTSNELRERWKNLTHNGLKNYEI